MSDVTVQGGQEVVGVSRIEGPILVVEGAANVSYDEVVEIQDARGQLRRGRVLEVGEGFAVVQVFAGSTGLSIDGTRVRFLGTTLHIPVTMKCSVASLMAWAIPLTAVPSRSPIAMLMLTVSRSTRRHVFIRVTTSRRAFPPLTE